MPQEFATLFHQLAYHQLDDDTFKPLADNPANHPTNHPTDSQTSLIDETVHGYYIGMMSGTSLDGLDVVICQFDVPDDNPPNTLHQLPMRLIASHREPFDDYLKQSLLALSHPNQIATLADDVKAYLGGDDELVSELDFFGYLSVMYAKLCVQAIVAILDKANLTADDIIAIGVHGQTVRHRPTLQFSLQLVDANFISEHTGISVVSDFRRRDMAVGGQGAPLVPAFHADVFGRSDDKQTSKVVLNLGGIANITVLSDPIIGYDTGVANLLMDAWVRACLGVPYDDKGEWAKSGNICQALLDELLSHPFLAQAAPKSTGREAFNLAYLQAILAQGDFGTLRHQDIQATLCEFTAISASCEIAKYAKATNQLYVCGGGAYNRHLLTRLAYHLPNWQISTTQSLGINPTWVEAACFAWLARQSILGQAGNLPSVTGASRRVVLGQVSFA